MGMTREEEIDQSIQHWSEYYGVEFSAEAGNALAKIILARNRELQRRLEKLERVAHNAREAIKRFPKQVCLGIKLAVRALDAKDQDN